jgi:hypothetical protein
MNFAFIFTIILSQLLIFCLPLQRLSACSSSFPPQPAWSLQKEGPRQHRINRISLSTGPKSFQKWLFYFPFGKSAPTTTSRISPLYFGRSDFALSRIRRSSALSPISETRKQSTLTLPLSLFQTFPYHDFGRSRCQATCSHDSRNLIF